LVKAALRVSETSRQRLLNENKSIRELAGTLGVARQFGKLKKQQKRGQWGA